MLSILWHVIFFSSEYIAQFFNLTFTLKRLGPVLIQMGLISLTR